MKKIKVILLFVSVIGFMSLIYYFSSQSGMESHRLSKGIATHIIDLSPNKEAIKANDIVKYINFDFLFRKTVHFLEYFILCMLVYALAVSLEIDVRKSRIVAILVSGIYSITDEIHQSFVTGRTPLVTDMFIDALGSIAAMVLLYFVMKRRYKKKKNEG